MQLQCLVLETCQKLGFCVRVLLDLLSDVTFHLLYWNSRRGLPPVTNNILLLSASSLAEKIRKKEVTSEQLVEACIERIGEINSLVNAVVDRRFEEALEDAKKCDRIISVLSEPALEQIALEQPFLGVPFSTKEGIQMAGLHHSYGVPARSHIIASDDASAVKLLKKAGAIPICVTNVSEAGSWWNSSNCVYGTTNNPYSLSHNPGGSSGGEAVLQTCAGVPISLGSDTGGSIRTPAAFCGLFGHKPTPGTVSNVGADINDLSDNHLQSMQVLGSMTRHAEDLTPLLKVLLGDNQHLLQLDKEVFFTKCRFFYLTTSVGGNMVSPLDPEVRLANQRVVDFIEDNFGVIVTPLHIPELKDIFSLFTAELKRTSTSSLCSSLVGGPGSAWVSLEVARAAVGYSRHTAPVLMQASLERVGETVAFLRGRSSSQLKVSSRLSALRERVNNILGEDGILLSPSHPSLPPYHYQSFTKPFNFLYTAVHNTLGLPATVVPLGISTNGLPLSIQISAAEYNDHLPLALAKLLERPFGGWCPPFRRDESFGFY